MSERVILPAGTVLGKSFEYGIDLNLGTAGAPSWQPIRRMSGFAPTYPKTRSNVATYDDLGAPNEDVDGLGFATAFTVQGNRSPVTGLYLPEVERLQLANRSKGEAAVIDLRFYHKPESGTPNPNDAGRSFATVDVTRQNTDNTGNEVFAVAVTGKGEYTPIANPFTGWGTTIPVVAAVTPDAAAAGDLVTITGSGFLGATGAAAVKFGAVNAAEYLVINASTIIASLPAGAAGAAAVTVTTPGGTSSAFPYTRA